MSEKSNVKLNEKPSERSKIQTEKHQKIVDAAAKVFASKGFYNAKVADIAKEAAVADGTIYLYFKNKDDILFSIFESSMDVFISAIREKLKKIEKPADQLMEFINTHLELVHQNQAIAQVLQLELRQSSKFMQEYDVAKFKEYLQIIVDILSEGQRQGFFNKDINLHIASRALFGAVDEMALEWLLLKKKKYSIRDCAKQLGHMFVTGLRVPCS